MLKFKGGGGGSKKSQLKLDISSSSESESEQLQKNVSKRKRNVKGKKEEEGFSINKDYAERYDNWRNREEMQKLKDRLGVSNISDLKEDETSESSEEEMEWSPEQEKAFFKTLASLKMKDPTIYSDEFGFFKDEDKSDTKTKEGKKKKKEDKKPFTVRDHERVMILEKGGQVSEDEDDEGIKKSEPKSYNEELASIRNEFSKALNQIESSDEDDDGALLGSNLLKQKQKSKEEKEREDEAQKLWLKGELEKLEEGKLPKEDEQQLLFLRKYWTDEKLDDGEKFLRDYILNRKYIEAKDESDDEHTPSFNEVVHDDDELSNDEKFEAEREEFEHKYNFRFEEPDQDFIKRYPRTIQDSLRREDTKRKEQRQKAKDRKEEEKSKMKEDVQRLKALKRKEIMDKIQKLHEISGNPDLELTEMDIEGDFDPAEYDRRMQQIFNDDYYKEGDDQKPEFPFDEEIDDEANWEKWVPKRESKEEHSEGSEDNAEIADDDQPTDDDENEITIRSRGKQAAQKELIESSKGRRGRRKRSVFLDALEREKPKFDPKVHKSFEQYFEEYYNLDFEDAVGDIKCRFKYHKTTPNDFGLTMDEILKADDKELNKWASIKKTFQYRDVAEEEYEVQAYKNKSQKEQLKKKILLSVYQPKETENQGEQNASNETQQKKKRKKKKKKNKGQGQDSSNSVKDTTDQNPNKPDLESTSPKRSYNGQSEDNAGATPSPKKQWKKLNMNSTPTPPSERSGLSKRKRKNLKRTQKGENSNGNVQNKEGSESNGAAETKVEPEVKSSSKSEKKEGNKKKNFKRKLPDSNDMNGVAVDEERLRAYGLNPKKYKKRMKYGTSASKA